MPELEFRVEGNLSERLEHWRKENRASARANVPARLNLKSIRLSPGTVTLLVTLVVTFHLVNRYRSDISLDSLAGANSNRFSGTATQLGSSRWFPHALKGDIYFLPVGTDRLPDFAALKPVGTIYTDRLDVSPRSFTEGFPGVTGRFEWFAIDYNGRFSIDRPAKYSFTLTSDDGAKLFIDDSLIINNDGIHPASTSPPSTVLLNSGSHKLRVQYFQGPRERIALVLEVKHEGPP